MSSAFSLDPYFTLWFILLLAAAFFLQRKFSQSSNVPTTVEFKLFQDNFVLVYIFVVAADWLQGPYVYALYDAYGFTQQVHLKQMQLGRRTKRKSKRDVLLACRTSASSLSSDSDPPPCLAPLQASRTHCLAARTNV